MALSEAPAAVVMMEPLIGLPCTWVRLGHPGGLASRARHARSGHVKCARARDRSRCATANWRRNIKNSASFHHASQGDSLSSDIRWETIMKVSFYAHKPKIILPPD